MIVISVGRPWRRLRLPLAVIAMILLLVFILAQLSVPSAGRDGSTVTETVANHQALPGGNAGPAVRDQEQGFLARLKAYYQGGND